ncbi:MAG TPA: LptF/LptG family permease, partial [Ramlibacter sp.]|nr:LptF/LptG family permease [Ramlibacter sp.]
GFGVIFVYYVLLYMSRAGALGGRLSPTLAPWVANIVLGAAGVALVFWRAGSADQPIRIPIPAFWRRRQDEGASDAAARATPRRRRVVLVIRVPHVDWPKPRLLDLYISRRYLAVFGLAFLSLVGIFYISTFIDLADKLFRGTATTGLLLRYFYFATPQYVYYIIPMSALVATLVTIGLLTKNSELVVMRACGISLYRSAVPVLLFAMAFSGVLFLLQERVLAQTNREAQRLNAIIRGYPVQTFGVLNRRWVVGRNGDLLHYEFFEPRVNEFSKLSIFHVDQGAWRLNALTYADHVALARRTGADGRPALQWMAARGWTRAFATVQRRGEVRTAVDYAPFQERSVSLGPPSDFKTEEPDADRMTYGELKQYVTQLRASGYYAVPYMVDL